MDPQSLEHHLDGLQRSSVSNLSTIAQENELAMPRLALQMGLVFCSIMWFKNKCRAKYLASFVRDRYTRIQSIYRRMS